jgi:hypothetical protein
LTEIYNNTSDIARRFERYEEITLWLWTKIKRLMIFWF